MSITTTLSRKIQKVLETKTDSPDLLVALQNLSTFYNSNTATTRTNLRGEIEKRGLEINKDFLASFKEVQKVYLSPNSFPLSSSLPFSTSGYFPSHLLKLL